MAYVKRVVPEDKLFLFNVKDGWGPLCKILGCPVPEEPFPYVNSAAEMQEFLSSMWRKALFKWLQIITMLAVVVTVLLYISI